MVAGEDRGELDKAEPLQSPLAIDHIVLPVADLGLARERLSTLGFTVADEGLHPFGTANACIFFENDTYLEPLAIADPVVYEQAVADGNVFVVRDARFRAAGSPEGLSAVVLKSDDATAFDARIGDAGWSAGPMLSFERPVVMPDGRAEVASFRLAFATQHEAERFFLIAVQRINPLPVDRAALTRHHNGATRISGVALAAADPSQHQGFLCDVLAAEGPLSAQASLHLALANGRIFAAGAEDIGETFGPYGMVEPTGLECAVLVIAVADLGVTAVCLGANGVAFSQRGRYLLVKPAPGQGVAIAFEKDETI